MSTLDADSQLSANRHQLLFRVKHPDPNDNLLPPILSDSLEQLNRLIHQELPELTRHDRPVHITDLLVDMSKEYQRLAEFCEFPALGSKLVVGIGGAFSTGKSTFINSLLGGSKRLATEIDETTALPSYLMWGEQEQIWAINLDQCSVRLNQEEFLSLTHEEKSLYGSQVSVLLRSAYLILPEFPWRKLSLLDTPGYSKSDSGGSNRSSDADIARNQLIGCQFIIWLVQADAGIISENDLTFLSTLRQEIPLLVVVSRADKKTKEEIYAIIQLVRDTLENRGVSVLDVLPYSIRKKNLYPIQPILYWLDKWDSSPKLLNFSIVLRKYFFYISQWLIKKRRAQKIKSLPGLVSNDELINGTLGLKELVQQDCNQIETLDSTLSDIEHRLLKQLNVIASSLNMTIPEPGALDFLQPINQDFASMLCEVRVRQGRPEQDFTNVANELVRLEILERASANSLGKRGGVNRSYSYDFSLESWDKLRHKIKLKELSLPAHTIAELSVHERELYFCLLSLLLLAGGKVSMDQQWLLELLSRSMGLDGKLPVLVARAQQMNHEDIEVSVTLLKEKQLANTFIVDVLVLCRLDQFLNQEQFLVLSELVILLDLYPSDIPYLTQPVKLILGLSGYDEIPSNFNINELNLDCWKDFLYRELTANHLKSGVSNGYWRISKSLNVDFSFSLFNVLVEFHNNSYLNIKYNGSLKFSNSSFINPVILIDGNNKRGTSARGDFLAIGCSFEGSYDEVQKLTVFKLKNVSSYFENILFKTKGARSIQSSNGNIYINKSVFNGCGNSNMIGGGISSRSKNLKVESTEFLNCYARVAGGIGATGACIMKCTFKDCESYFFINKINNCSEEKDKEMFHIHNAGGVLIKGSDNYKIEDSYFFRSSVKIDGFEYKKPRVVGSNFKESSLVGPGDISESCEFQSSSDEYAFHTKNFDCKKNRLKIPDWWMVI